MLAAFDVGGTLRAPRIPGVSQEVKQRRYDAMHAIYRALSASKEWDVIIVCAAPHSEIAVRLDILKMGLPEPGQVVVVPEQTDKHAVYARLRPDVVFDNESLPLADALACGALTCKVA